MPSPENDGNRKRFDPEAVWGVITVYLDYEAADRALEACFAQTYPLRGMWVIDNSPTPDREQQQAWDGRFGPWLQRLDHPENIGISGALRRAFALAREQSVDWLWTLDQDSEPAPDCLEVLIQSGRHHELRPVLGPLITETPTGSRHLGSRFDGYRYRQLKTLEDGKPSTVCDLLITAGMLIPSPLFQVWEGPEEWMFIDGVDTRICEEAQRRGHPLILEHRAEMSHRFGQPKIHREGRSPLHEYSPLRCFFIGRNHTWLEWNRARGKQKARTLVHRWKVALTFARNAFRVGSAHPWQCSWAVFTGTLYGFLGIRRTEAARRKLT